MRLARELGMSKARLLHEMDSREIAEWQAYLIVEDEESKKPKNKKPQELISKLKSIAPTGGKSVK
jgi:hypothetical protein